MRLIPHPPNFVPITAIAIFAGVLGNVSGGVVQYSLNNLISDLFIGFYSISLFVYLAFILITTYSYIFKKYSIKNILLSSIIFFIITNFGVWFLPGGYPNNIEGLILCYTAAIPFFTYSIIADLFFSAILYYGFEKIEKRYLILKS